MQLGFGFGLGLGLGLAGLVVPRRACAREPVLGDPHAQRRPLHEAEHAHLEADAHRRAQVYAALQEGRVEEAQQEHLLRSERGGSQLLTPQHLLRVGVRLRVT